MNIRIDILKYLLAAALFCCLVLCMFSCKTIQPAPIPTNTHNRDSVRTEYVHDSIYTDRWHTIYTKGDTVYIHDSIYFAKWKHDSIFVNIEHTDTIYQTVQVEKPQSQFLRNSGIALWVLIALLVVAIIIGIVLKFAK